MTLSFPALAIVGVVFAVVSALKTKVKFHPLLIGWVTAGLLTAAAFVFFPGEMGLDGMGQVVVGVLSLQGTIKNVHEAMKSLSRE